MDTVPFSFPTPSFLDGNPYFSAGFGLAVMGFGIQLFRRSGVYLQLFASRSFLTTLEINNHDPAFPWIIQWLNDNSKHNFRRVCVETYKRQTQSGKSITNFSLVPSQGRHFIKYQNTYLMIERDRELRARGGNNESTGVSNIWESIKFTTIGKSPQIYDSLLNDARNLATEKDFNYTTIYTSWGYQGWKPFGNARRKRNIQSVILAEGITDDMIADISEFLCKRDWYQLRGIPYRRGYLLYGKPGSGKSSFVQALAGHMGYDICIMSLAQPGLTDDHLAISLINIPEKSIILFEDIDCLFSNREELKNGRKNFDGEKRNSNGNNYLTFSGFLNAMDGVSAGEERLVFMTTNFIEKLDGALMRPGRIDVIQYFGDANEYQIRQMLYKFYPEILDILNGDDHTLDELKIKIDTFVNTFCESSSPISMAELQEYFLLHKHSMNDAFDDAGVFVDSLLNNPRNQRQYKQKLPVNNSDSTLFEMNEEKLDENTD